MNVKARFKCIEIRHVAGAQPNACLAELKFMAAYNDGKGNEDWSKWTPSGEIKMMVTNPRAIEAFELGKEYELTFAPDLDLAGDYGPTGLDGAVSGPLALGGAFGPVDLAGAFSGPLALSGAFGPLAISGTFRD